MESKLKVWKSQVRLPVKMMLKFKGIEMAKNEARSGATTERGEP